MGLSPSSRHLILILPAAIESSSRYIRKNNDNTIDSTVQELNNRATSLNATLEDRLNAVVASKPSLHRPLIEEEVRYDDRDGRPTAQKPLFERMHALQETVEAEQKRLEELWKEWHKINAEITSLALETVGPDASQVLASCSKVAPQINTAERKEYVSLVTKEEQRLKSEVKSTSADLLGRMKENEKVDSSILAL